MWTSPLSACSQGRLDSYLIIKRRVAWLIGKWIGDNCAPLNDQRIWQILTYLLTDKGEGTEVIRLTTAGAIKDSLNVRSPFDHVVHELIMSYIEQHIRPNRFCSVLGLSPFRTVKAACGHRDSREQAACGERLRDCT